MERPVAHFNLPRLHKLLPEEIEEVIDDLNLLKKKAIIYFAVDPYEIAEFCFPINPNETNRSPDIDLISDDQAAFYEIFYRRLQKPVLLPEYTRELRGILSYFERHLAIAYDKAEILQELIKAGGLKAVLDENKKEYKGIAEDYFNIILAVARGVYSLGVDRFREIFYNHLLSGQIETTETDDKEALHEIFDGYVETNLGKVIYGKVMEELTEYSDSVVETERRKRTLMVDADAIARTLYLNKAFEEAHQKGKLKRLYIILYLSSAARTETMFKLPEVQESLPRIDGRKYNIWRTRRQIFAYVVHKSNNRDPREQLTETIKNLEKVKKVLTEIKKLEKNIAFQCDQCILKENTPKGHTPKDCPLVNFCKDVQGLYEDIQRARLQVKNLGLVNTLGDYERVVQQHREKSKGKNSSFESYLKLFDQVCRSGIRDIARDRMQQKQQWILIKSEATNLFKEGFTLAKEEHEKHSFRTRADSITGIDHILPTKPKLKSGKYRKMLNLILDYYKDPIPERFELLQRAYKDYVNLDPGLGQRDPEQELINCYLYLAFGKGRDERKAYEFAKGLVKTVGDAKADTSMEQEYRYVLLWAARRQGKFEEADECANVALSKWPEDPRFYHGRCLNTYAWMLHQNQAGDCPYNTWDAIKDAQKAITLYAKDGAQNEDVIAVNYNNIAYLLAMEVTNKHTIEEAHEILSSARQALTKLKDLVKKETWNPNHPEYFHTEAFLEYQEFLVGFTRGEDVEKLKKKLEYAKEAIDMAVQIYEEGPDYRKLKEQIEKSLSEISSGRLRRI